MAEPAASDVNFILNIAQLLALVGGAVAFIWRISKMATKFEFVGTQQAKEIKEIKEETHELRLDVEKLNDIMIEITKTQGRMDLNDERVLAQGKRLDEQIQRFNEWTERVYEERHRQLTARVSRIENGQ